MAPLIEVLKLLPSFRDLVRLPVHRRMMVETLPGCKSGRGDGHCIEPAGPHCLAAAGMTFPLRSRSLAAPAEQRRTHNFLKA